MMSTMVIAVLMATTALRRAITLLRGCGRWWAQWADIINTSMKACSTWRARRDIHLRRARHPTRSPRPESPDTPRDARAPTLAPPVPDAPQVLAILLDDTAKDLAVRLNERRVTGHLLSVVMHTFKRAALDLRRPHAADHHPMMA